jgi:hypothetical protein
LGWPAWASLLLAVGLAAAPGCSDGRPKRSPVSGLITYHGKPVEGAQVTFFPKGGRPATGSTDANGRFKLFTFDLNDGALLGEHVVCIRKYVPDPKDSRPAGFKNMIPVVPTRYGSLQESSLRATVTADGPNDFHFELVDSPA